MSQLELDDGTEGRRDRQMTTKGQEYQVELLWKEVKRRRAQVTNSIGLFESLLRTKDATAVKKELSQTDTYLTDLASVVHRLCKLLEGEGKAQVEEMLAAEEDSVARVKRSVLDWIEELNKDDKSDRSRQSAKSSKFDGTSHSEERKKRGLSQDPSENNRATVDLEESTMAVASEMMKTQIELEKQVDLVDNLFESNDRQFIDEEVRKLEETYKDFKSVSAALRPRLPQEGAEKIKSIEEKEEVSVQNIRLNLKNQGMVQGEESEKIDNTIHTEFKDKLEYGGREEQSSELSIRNKQRISTKEGSLVSKGSRKSGDHPRDPRLKMSRNTPKKQPLKDADIADEIAEMDDSYTQRIKMFIEDLPTRKEHEDKSNMLSTADLDTNFGRLSVKESLEKTKNRNAEGKSSVSAFSGRSGSLKNTTDVYQRWEGSQNTKTSDKKRVTTKPVYMQEGSQVSKGSRQSSRSSNSRRSKSKEVSEEILTSKLIKTRERLESQTLLIKDLFTLDDVEMVKRELSIMEQVHETVVTVSYRLMQIVSADKANQISNQMTEDDAKILGIKKQVIQWMVKQEDDEEGSVISQSSRRTIASSVSTRSTNDFRKRIGPSNNQHREKDGKGYKERIDEKIKQQKFILDKQKKLCVRIQFCQEASQLRQAVKSLEEEHRTLVKYIQKLHELLPRQEAETLMRWVETENDEVFQIKQMMIKKIAENLQEKDPTAKVKNDEKDVLENSELRNAVSMENESGRLKAEVDRIRTRLGSQKDLVENILKSNDTEMVNQEVETLDKIHDDLVAAASHLRELSSPEEAEKMSMIIDKEDASVFRTKKVVAKWQTSLQRKNESAMESSQREPRGTSATAREEVKGEVGEGIAVDCMERPEGKAEERNSEEGRKSTDMIRLNELMVQALKLQSAPRVEIDSFSGDPLEYNYFITTFKDVVENLINDPRQRLVRLLKYTRGEAKELIKHCVHDESANCYEAALSLLEQEYGNSFQIACAYLEKLKSWPQIKANDAAAIKNLYRFLLRCASYQKVGALDLDSPLTIRSIQLCLPMNLQDKWTRQVGRIRMKKSGEASFADFVEFIKEESQALNDPIYSRGGFKDKKGNEHQIKVAGTEVKEKEGPEQKKKEIECPLCKSEHDLDDCEEFKSKDGKEKKELLFKIRLCFSCYGKGHQVSKCTSKRICSICEKDHPTGLHEVKFKVSAIHGSGEGSMCIVRVRLQHRSAPEKEIEVYAMLDECSQGTFVDEELILDIEEEEKRKTNISVTTVSNSEGVTMESYAIQGFVVRCAKEHEERYGCSEVKLPVAYSKRGLPMDKEDIPKAENLSRWNYLKEVVRSMPEVKDIPLGLLIGNNCPKALEPLQVILSQGDGPYGKRTRLGWCVIGPAGGSSSSSMRCNSARVTSLREVSTELAGGRQLVVPTKITDNAIADALQEMWRTDFVERQSEKEAMSKEDKWFLDEMKKSVRFEGGHYVLPLPIREEMKKSVRFEEGHYELPLPTRDQTISSINSEGSRIENAKKVDIVAQGSKERREVIEIVPPDAVSRGKGGINGRQVVMPDNRRQAVLSMNYNRRRMCKDKTFNEEYSSFMSKLFRLGFARIVPQTGVKEKGWFLTHHGVYHPTKGKMRVVFNCSAEQDGVSLNSKLLQGPDLMNGLLGVLLKFREGKIPFMADIESMYHQVRVPDEYSKFLRFFWWKDNDPTKEMIECEMTVHPFGAISSKNCVIFALHQTAFDNQDEFGKEAAEALLQDFYMDDLLKSMDDKNDVIKLIKNIDGMCSAGGFNLTKFVCTDQEVMNSIPPHKRAEGLKEYQIGSELPVERPLGVKWDIQTDSFGFQVSFDKDDGTRRGSLATISGIYDPYGLEAPFVLGGRKILQKMTANSAGWDKHRELEVDKKWMEWRKDVLLLNEIEVRRCYRSEKMKRVVSTSLHCFSDASFVGYGVAIYLRMVDEEGNVEVTLVMGKSRVSPLKPTTVPRLELTAATVSAKIAALVMEELRMKLIEIFFWVDNKIVLGYILNQTRRFRIFVANRVRVIDERMKEMGEGVEKKWRYVETKENPADYASRGISPTETEKVDVWFNGPKFLREADESWRDAKPEVVVLEGDSEVMVEKKVHAIKVPQTEQGVSAWSSILDVLEKRISSWYRMKRVMVWVDRFINRCRKKGLEKDSEPSAMELENAERKIVILVQARCFESEMEAIQNAQKEKMKKKERKGRLWKLNPFVDQYGVLRVGGRLSQAQEDPSFCFPIIFPKRTTFTKRLIEWHHKQIEHRGKHTTVCRLREYGFWIVNASKEVGAVVFRCVRCKWLRGRFEQQMMANLPFSRTTTEPPFTYCGVDVFGPMQVKQGRKVLKRYGVLFTCFSLRAVHIELASSLETDSFIQALRRFIARRGSVREIRCDNGTNFVGAGNELKAAWQEMDHKRINAFMTEQGGDWINWERNTPYASNMGGVWERQIRTVKNILSSLVKSTPRALDEEMMRTFLAEAEAIVNSRPLTIEKLHDPESTPLSPSQILTMKSRLVSPPPGVFQKEDVYCRKRWRVVQSLAESFWSRWRKEYLQLLQSRQKWTEARRNLKPDDVVLLKEEGVRRGHWPMARVTEVHKSGDGLVRSVFLRVGDTILKRPVNKTVLLVAATEEE